MKLFKRTVTLLVSLIIISGLITYFLAFYDNGKTKISDAETKAILSLLDKHNIKIKEDVLPKSYPDLPVISLKNAVSERLVFAEKVLGKDFSIISSDTYIKDEKIFTTDKNKFSITFENEDFFKTEFMLSNPESYGSLVKKALLKLGFSDSEFEITVNTKEGYASVFKTVDGFPVFDCSFTVNFDNGISSISGIWFDTLDKHYYKKHKALTTVISSVSENPDFYGKEITEISAGYKIGEFSGEQREVRAMPVWRITFDNKITYDYKM